MILQSLEQQAQVEHSTNGQVCPSQDFYLALHSSCRDVERKTLITLLQVHIFCFVLPGCEGIACLQVCRGALGLLGGKADLVLKSTVGQFLSVNPDVLS